MELLSKPTCRVQFPKGEQKLFIESVLLKSNLTNIELAKILGVHVRTLNDWKREKFLMSLEAAKILSTKSETKLPENIEIMDQFWYTENGGSAGGVAVYKKYGRVGGDPIIRKRRWQEWWENIGKFKKQSILEARPIKKPGASKYLAEYAGILMGDGGLTQYQSLITLNCVDDLEYSKFVVKLIEKLFKISPSVVFRKNSRVLTIRLSRVNHVKFLVSIGIVIGNKIGQQIDIPV